jgi:hypothetical protein
MAISTLDQYIAAAKQRVRIFKTASRTTVATIPFSVFDQVGTPQAGNLAGTNTAQGGTIQTDAVTGFPGIGFTTGVGYISKVEYGSSIACRLSLYDMILKMGAISYVAGNSIPTNDTQPNISSRCPDYPGSGTTYGAGVEMWVEVSTAFVTGTAWQVQVTYRNQAGTSGRTSVISVAQAAAALTLGKMFQMTLQAGDTGVQRIEQVTVTNGGTVMTAGAFNIILLRPLWTNGRVRIANDGDVHDMLKTGLPIIYTDSALYLVVEADSTASGIPEVSIEIVNG